MGSYSLSATCTLRLVSGDITKLRVDAIVNAANERMLGGGGVDGAIHRAAGPELRQACEKVPIVAPTARGAQRRVRVAGEPANLLEAPHSDRVRCPTGEARITRGFALPAEHVIHTVGPVYRDPDESGRLLASAYRSSLALAAKHELETMAFPAISCGVFGYPLRAAGDIALGTCRDFCQVNPNSSLTTITFALFGRDVMRAFEAAATVLFRDR